MRTDQTFRRPIALLVTLFVSWVWLATPGCGLDESGLASPAGGGGFGDASGGTGGDAAWPDVSNGGTSPSGGGAGTGGGAGSSGGGAAGLGGDGSAGTGGTVARGGGTGGVLDGGDGGTFEPTDIVGCRVWLRADKDVSTDGSGQVISWVNHGSLVFLASVTQTDPARRPALRTSGTAGLPDLDFDGVNDALSAVHATTPQPFSRFVVASPDETGLTQVIVDGGLTSATRSLISVFAQQWEIWSGQTSIVGGSAQAGTPQFLGAVFNHPSSELYVGGVQVATPSATGPNPSDGLVLGARGFDGGFPFNGKISEVLEYEGVLSTPDTQQVVAYLKARYGL